MRKFGNQCSIPFCIIGLLIGPAVAADVQQLVVTGDPAPGTNELYFQLYSTLPPLLNSSGRPAFDGPYQSDIIGGEHYQAIWTADPFTLGVRSDDNAPGTADAQFQDFSGFAWGDGDDLLIEASLTGPGVSFTNNSGLWSGPPGVLNLLAREGDPAPGTENGVYFSDLFEYPFQINSNGMALFANQLEGPGVVTTNRNGIWAGQPGALQLLAREGDPAPDFGESTVITSLEGATINNNDIVALSALTSLISPNFYPVQGLWVGPPDDLQVVMRTDEPPPGNPGIFILSMTPPSLNNASEIAFIATWLSTNYLSSGLSMWYGPANQLQVLDFADTIADTEYHILSAMPPTLNDTGQLAFTSVLTDEGNSIFLNALLAGPADALEIVAMQGMQAPGLASNVVFYSPFMLAFNDHGTVAFTDTVSGPDITATKDRTLWMGPADNPQLVLQEGDMLEVAPGTYKTVDTFAVLSYVESINGQTPLSNTDELIFWVGFVNDGFDAIFVASLDGGSGGNGELTLQRIGGDAELSWIGDGFTLQFATELSTNTTWTTATNQTNPQIITFPHDTGFYRLLK